jgi:hypothetical protein
LCFWDLMPLWSLGPFKNSNYPLNLLNLISMC